MLQAVRLQAAAVWVVGHMSASDYDDYGYNGSFADGEKERLLGRLNRQGRRLQ